MSVSPMRSHFFNWDVKHLCVYSYELFCSTSTADIKMGKQSGNLD
ncbi:hypothetical protein [Nostoc sp.]